MYGNANEKADANFFHYRTLRPPPRSRRDAPSASSPTEELSLRGMSKQPPQRFFQNPPFSPVSEIRLEILRRLSQLDLENPTIRPRHRCLCGLSVADTNISHSLLDLSSDQLRDVVHARARRRINRGLKRRPMGLIKKLRKAKQEARPNEKPDPVKTHLRDMIVVPEMIGSVISIYSGKEFNQVEIKPEMVGHYLAEFSIS